MDGINFSSNNVFTNLTGGTYFFFAQDANGCIVKTGYGFIGEFIAQNNCGFYCNGEGGLSACKNDGTIDIVAEAGTPPYQYSIDGVNFQSSPFLNNSLDYNNLPSGLYHLWARDAKGVLVVSGYQLLQICYVAITYIGVDATCQQSDGSITITAKNGTAPYTYTIDGVNFQASNVFSGLAKGTYSVSVRDATGMLYSRQVVMYDKCPTVTVTETDETCGQKDGTLTATGFKGTTPYSYSIDGVNYQASAVFPSLSAGSYTVTLKDANGFSSTASATIKNNCMKLSGSVANSTCGNNNGMIVAIASNGVMPYQYSIDGLNFQIGNVFPALSAGSYNLSAMDANGLTASAPLTIPDIPGPQINVTTTQASCDNTNGIIQITATGGTAPLTFSIDNGVTTQPANIFNGLDSGSYTAVAKDANGCVATNKIHLIALPTPAFSIGKDTTICQGQTLLVNGPVTPGLQYLWQDNSTASSLLVSSPGAYALKITNSSGCSATRSINVNFSPLPVFSIGNDTVLCSGINLELSPQPLPQGIFLWSTGSTATFLNVATAGLYSLKVSNNGCASQQSITIGYKPTPFVSLGNDTTICEGQTLVLDATNNNSVYTWQDGSDQSTFTVTQPGRFSVTVLENGCETSDDVAIQFNDRPQLKKWTDTAVCVTQQLMLDAYYPQSTYLWQDGSTGSQFKVTAEGVYAVDVTNGCGDTRNLIKVAYENCACLFSVPNAFTPNYDGVNDVFRPRNQCQFSDYELKIFNRWGQMVFSSRNATNGWDGTFEGQLQPDGTYVWVLNYTDNLTGKKMNKPGTLLLLR